VPMNLHEMAKALVGQGEKVTPLRGGTKVPALLQPYALQSNAVSFRFWFASRRSNAGRVPAGLAVLECDTEEAEHYLSDLKAENPYVVLPRARQRKHRYLRTMVEMQSKSANRIDELSQQLCS
jgi:hypothetical protein